MTYLLPLSLEVPSSLNEKNPKHPYKVLESIEKNYVTGWIHGKHSTREEEEQGGAMSILQKRAFETELAEGHKELGKLLQSPGSMTV